MLSAKQGFDLAQYKIATFYWYSFGVNRDTDKIRYWAGLAAKQGNKDAKKLLKDLPQWIYAEEQTEKNMDILAHLSLLTMWVMFGFL